MSYSWSMYRDQIIIDSKLASDINRVLKERGIPTDTQILFAARIIEIRSDFEIMDYDLVFLADSFDGSGGTIRVKVTRVPADGQPGRIGHTVTLASKKLRGLKVETYGGVGGKGLAGDPGQDGADGRINSPRELDGKDGAKGGKGKTGGTGGNGGNVTIYYIQDEIPGGIGGPMTVIASLGGEGGPGGPGGPGGKGGNGATWCKPDGTFCVEGRNGNPGPQGDTGDPGVGGANGGCQIQSLLESEYWNTIRPLAADWARYRMMIGEYYYRAFNTKSSEKENFIDLAKGEFEAVLALDPSQTQAQVYITQLLDALTIYGQPRFLDIIPDFPKYEGIFTRYHPIVGSIFDAAERFLNASVDFNLKKQDLAREASNIDNLVDALEDELAAALLNKDKSEKEFTFATQDLENLRAKIAAKRNELDQAQVEVFGAIIGTVGLVASVVAAIPTAGASLTGAAMAIAAIGDAIKSYGAMNLVKDAFKDPKTLPEDTGLKKLQKEADGLKAYVEKAKLAITTIFSFEKMLKELWQAKINGAAPDTAALQKLIEDGIQASHKQLLADLAKKQSALAADAAGKRLQQAKLSSEAAKAQHQALTNDLKILEGAAFLLLKLALYYADILQQYRFSALRAVEIYTLKDYSDRIRFDYGYVHPDSEKDYQEGFDTMISLITKYRMSWSGLTDLLDFRHDYDGYFASADWVLDYERLSFKQSGVIALSNSNDYFRSKSYRVLGV